MEILKSLTSLKSATRVWASEALHETNEWCVSPGDGVNRPLHRQRGRSSSGRFTSIIFTSRVALAVSSVLHASKYRDGTNVDTIHVITLMVYRVLYSPVFFCSSCAHEMKICVTVMGEITAVARIFKSEFTSLKINEAQLSEML